MWPFFDEGFTMDTIKKIILAALVVTVSSHALAAMDDGDLSEKMEASGPYNVQHST